MEEKGIIKKEDRRVRRTRKALTLALTELLQQKQINEITVTELTALADMNRGTFYLYYRDIYHMLNVIEDEMFQELDRLLRKDLRRDDPEQIRSFMVDLLNFVRENQELTRVLLSPNGDMKYLHRLSVVFQDRYMELVPPAQNPDQQAEYEYRYQFFVYGMGGLIRAWVNRNCAESPESLAALMYQLYTRGALIPA